MSRKHELTKAKLKRSVPDATYEVADDEPPFPYNRTLRGLSFSPYTCSKCGYLACDEEFGSTDRSIPLLRTLGAIDTYSVCPPDEGPHRAELQSPDRYSWRSRVTHRIHGRLVTACMLGGVLERTKNQRRCGTLIGERELLREIYLGCYLEDRGPLDDLDLDCLVEAPLRLGRVGKIGGVYIASRTSREKIEIHGWEGKARRLSLACQGKRPGFLSSDLATAMDVRLGYQRLDAQRFLHVPFDLSRSLQDQWKHILLWLDELAEYAYRFTKARRPRKRPSLYRDIYVFLAVKVCGRSVRSVAHEVFKGESAAHAEKKVRAAAQIVGTAAKAAGILITPLAPRMPE